MKRRAVVLSFAVVVTCAGTARAQAVPADSAASPIFGTRDWVLVGGLVAAQVVLFPFDEDLRSASGRVRGEATDAVSDVLRPLGRPEPIYVGSAAAYALGRLVDQPRLADLGLHSFLSLTLANVVMGGMKGVTGRARPWELRVQGTDSTWVYHGPREWSPFAGFSDGGPRQSFPSGHTTTAFVLATVLAEELGGVTPWLAYPVAAGVGWSRLNDEAHWTTDVVMGALVGIVAGRLVVRYGHERGGWLERTLLFEPDALGNGTRVGLRLPIFGS
jgi:membrane-associated phospholipid phosphatase